MDGVRKDLQTIADQQVGVSCKLNSAVDPKWL